MDVTLSSNPQTLTLISCTPFSSSSKLRSIRREFLGYTQTLRPLRCRTNHRRRKLGLLQFQSPKFLVQASLDSRSVLVVVAVVTFSAVSVFFLNRYRRKNNDSEALESDRKRKKSKGLKDKIRENGQASGDKDALLIFHASALILEEAGLNSIGMALKVHYFLLHRLGLKA